MQDLNDKITGSVLTAAEFVEIPSEIQNVIEALGQTLTSGDLNQLGKSIAGYIANGTFYTDSGIADAYVLNKIGLKQTATAYTDGFLASFIAGNDNTGASTVNVASLGVKNIVLPGGGVLAAGDISGRVEISFDSANDRFELLNAKVTGRTFEFDSTVEMKADPLIRVGMKTKTLGFTTKGDDGAAGYDTIAGTGTANGTTILAHDTLSLSYVLRDQPIMTIETFGAVAGLGGKVASSAAIRSAATFRGARGVIIPAKRYLYDRTAITDSDVKFIGEKMPVVNSGFTSLEEGSIIQGTIQFTGKNVHLENFGADLGSATSEADGDGIKAKFGTINDGGHLHTENLIALLPAVSTPTHALLFESYLKHTGGNLTGIHGLFGFVNKCQNVQLTTLYTKRNQDDGVFLKSDNLSGKCAKVNIGSIDVDGNAGQTFGLRIQSAGDDIEDINIGNVIVDGCARSYKADLNGTNGTAIKHVKIVNFLSKNASIRDIDIESAKAGGLLFDHKMVSVTCVDTLLEGYKVHGVASPDFITVDGLFISYKTGVSVGQMEAGAVQVLSSVLRTKMDKVTIVQNFSSSLIGGITYSNSSSNNQLGMHTAKIFGSMPLSGDSSQALSGGAAALTVPVAAWNSKQSNARISLTANTTVTSMTINPYTGTLFETGTVLTILNASSFDLTINNGFGGKILNRAGANITLLSNEAAMYMFGGAVWHQLN